MLFNSYIFILVFLPITLIGFIILERISKSRSVSLAWLVLASLFYYGWWEPVYVALILGSMVANFFIGIRLSSDVKRLRRWILLIVGIALNLSLLGYFKYYNFVLDTIISLLTLAGNNPNWTFAEIFLPLGISFFTFQQMTYLVDAYRGETKEYSFTDYALFVTFFPQLIAGPIVHHREMLPQFTERERYRFNKRDLAIGITIFTIGLTKKVLIADRMAEHATPVFTGAIVGSEFNWLDAWIGALTYTFQLYFDFSGYSDMAIGLGRMFGIRLPLNFHSPYKSTNIIEFWRRWHITLSRFLRDYLYIPLGGSHHGKFRRYLNLMITMLLGGLWHGAGWTFVVWGGLHGLYLMINHAWLALWGKTSKKRGDTLLGIWFGRLCTFMFVVIGWVYFRAENFSAANRMVATMYGWNGFSTETLIATKYGFIAVLLGLLMVWGFPNTQQIMRRFQPAMHYDARADDPARKCGLIKIIWKPNIFWATVIGLLFMVNLLSLNKVSEFIYFQF